MTDSQRPLGRHQLTEDEKRRIREQAEAEYRAELERQLREQPVEPAVTVPAVIPTPEKPRSAWQEHADAAQAKEEARRAALTPEQRERERRSQQRALVLFCVVMLPVGFILLRSCGADYLQGRQAARERKAAEAAAAKTLAGQDPYLIRESCLSSVRNKLKSPTSAKFYDDALPAWDGSMWSWSSYVDAQNGFGAMIRSPFSCVVAGSTPDDARVLTTLDE